MRDHDWKTVPGADGVRLLEMQRKPNILCSNAYVLDAPEAIVIIDPGADEQQALELVHLTGALYDHRRRSVFVALTHCHVDHAYCTSRLFQAGFPARLLCHARAAEALRQRDGRLSFAAHFGWELPEFDRPADEALYVESAPCAVRPVVSLGTGCTLDACCLPGHSLDSLGFQVGEVFFAGDLPFAAATGIAGGPGWDREALIGSLEGILGHFEAKRISCLLPGHGATFPEAKAVKVLHAALDKARRLSSIDELTPARVALLQRHARIILDEAESLFAIIGGKLLRLAHYLETLGEETAGERVLEQLDLAALEGALDDFALFSKQCDDQGKLGKLLHLPKTVQFVERSLRVLQPHLLQGLVEPALLRRAKRLLLDFINEVDGVRFGGQAERADLAGMTSALVAELTRPTTTHYDEVDDEAAFVRALTRQIAFQPFFHGVEVVLRREEQATPSRLQVVVDPQAFADVLTALLEHAVILGARTLELSTSNAGRRPCLRLAASAPTPLPALRPEKRSYFHFALRRLGGSFVVDQNGPILVCYVELPGTGQ